MNQHLQSILNLIQQDESLTAEEKNNIAKSLNEADKELEITAFKLDRTEKVKRTTAILLEETIDELEQKRKVVEAQSRDLEIESSLERVRAKAMAMHHSDELSEVLSVLFDQFDVLGISPMYTFLSFIDLEKNNFTYRQTGCGGKRVIAQQIIDLNAMDVWNEVVERWKAAKYDTVETMYVPKQQVAEVFRIFDEIYAALPEDAKVFPKDFPDGIYTAIAASKFGHLGYDHFRPSTEEEKSILLRFNTEFVRLYQRFLDLQKAEAQAREAQIEAALERVRSRSMGMQKSEELREVGNEIYKQLIQLNFNIEGDGFILDYPETDDLYLWGSDRWGAAPDKIHYPYFDHPYFNQYKEAKDKGLDFLIITNTFEEKNTLFDHFFQYLPAYTPEIKEIIYTSPGLVTAHVFLKNVVLYVWNMSGTLFSETENATLMRFGKVFEQAYIRFKDLEKAEAQAREAQIEASLERVRSKAMAMHKSEDFNGAVATVFEELNKLNLGLLRCGIAVLDKKKPRGDIWITIKSDQSNTVQVSGDEPLDIHPLLKGAYDAWLKQEDFYYVLQNEDLTRYYQAIKKTNFQLPIPATFNTEEKDQQQYYFNAAFQDGSLFAFLDTAFTDEAKMIMKRFANVFNLTYKRFLDLQKAEAQAREAQIELALERVRARAMAMQNSDELSALVAVLFEELTKLNLVLYRCIIWIFNPDTLTARMWMANSEDKENAESYFIKRLDHPYYNAILKGWKERNSKWVYDLHGNDKESIDELLLHETELSRLPESVKTGILSSEHTIVSGSFNNFGLIEASGPVSQTEEQLEILGRFGKVFDLTYTRFNDLKQAEAQAREAQIEASLERVRSKAMAMHKSEDLNGAVATVFDELDKLNLGLIRCGIAILDKEKPRGDIWITIKSDQGNTAQVSGDEPLDIHPLLKGAYDAWLQQEDFYYVLQNDELFGYYQAITRTSFQLPISATFNTEEKDQRQYYFNAIFQDGSLFAFLDTAFTDEAKMVMKRFANVFNLTYKRFLDLQKAEAQAREAQIEAALERVRGKAMAMHNSNDLSSTASTIFTELRKLDINPIRCGVGLLNKESHKAQLYSATSSENGDNLALVGWVQLEKHPVLEKIYDSWLQQEDYFPQLQGEQLRSYYQSLLEGLPVTVPDFTNDQKQYGYFIPFSIGCLYAWSNEQYNDAQVKIMRRFASIVDLTFRRYLELQQSEVNAREAVKQAALDRIRADIASMRTIADLDNITPLIWNELNILGIPFIRCGVFIMDDLQQLIHTFLSTPDGKAIAAFHLPYDTPGNLSKVLSHWNEHENYVDHWDESAFTDLAEILVKQGAIASPGQYLSTIPHGGFYLHFLPFLQGMLYVGNTAQLKDEDIQLIQSVADAFSTAYARYEDFNKLEAAKQQVDKTLVDLKQAQTQLVQSEKMASLGELTAGIAHEIQNPLNFVNNFSEVSNELLDEMIAELGSGNKEDAIAIADDVKQNLEKILHHGKRADGIVKGMLQHSRSSTAIKEPTDINKLADEYLRLAYHGLRAKDKSFNATLKTDFDESIGTINVIPQDIGRAVLNLITNAFYAAGEKRKQAGDGYEPIVSVSTKRIGEKAEIRVGDNGNGIPQKILDKIFQPFFTTKPTGQGTGLGLSLSYDIVKAHGGDLKVETKEGYGSEFIVQLPAV